MADPTSPSPTSSLGEHFHTKRYIPSDSWHVYVFDRQTGEYELASVSHDGVYAGEYSQGVHTSISADGRFVAFDFGGSYLVPDDTNQANDIFVRDLVENRTERVSIDESGIQADNSSFIPGISADGRYVTFHAEASNLTDGLSYAAVVHDRATGTNEIVSRASDGSPVTGSTSGAISADGRVVAFLTWRPGTVPDKTTSHWDVFVRIRWAAVVAGDVDGNGQVTMDDARTLLRMAAGLESASNDHITRGDMDGDKALTRADATVILRGL